LLVSALAPHPRPPPLPYTTLFRSSKVGDTITTSVRGAEEPLEGYADPKPMVYSGLFPIDGSDYPVLRDALDKLKLNDAALNYEPDRKSTRLNSSHVSISYAVFCLK